MKTTPVLEVADAIDHSPIGRLHVRIFTLCVLCMIMDGFDVQALGYVAPALTREWGVAPSSLGPIFGAGNFGVLIGQLTFTMLADRIGRRPVLVFGTVLFALATLATSQVSTLPQLLTIRLIAGIGMGSIIPNATALVGEFSPNRVRIAWMTWLSIGFTAGAALGGFVAAWLIPAFGWRSVFYVGGTIPLILSLAMFAWLPESLRWLVLHGRRRDYVERWLRRLDPAIPVDETTRFIIKEEAKAGVPAMHLFRDRRATATLLLWVVNFMNLFNLFSLANWLPTVATRAGYSTSTAVLIGTTLQVGGTLSPFLLTWFILRKGFVPVLTVTFAVAALSVAMIGYPGLSLAMLFVIVFIAGACVVGAQPSLNALAGSYYPTYLRSTGVGWALGIGRAGSIVGPVMAGQFLARQWTTTDIFLALSIPAVISMIAMAALRGKMRTP
jgi:AAHS family 4-hydroxybenzoate transporter-like MFS transporter